MTVAPYKTRLPCLTSVRTTPCAPYLGPDNTLRVGSTVNNLTGVLGYGFSAYRIQPTQAPAFTYAPRPVTPPSTGSANLKIASFNVLNYFNGDGNDGGFPTSRGADNLNEFKRQRAKIIAALKALDADVVGLIEMENDGDGANSAIADLVRGLNEATAPGTYDYIRDAANGGRGTDAIKVAFIYKPGKVTPVGSPLADLAAVHNRPPLAQTFRLKGNGEIVTAVINHFKSKGGTGLKADADQGDGQGAFNATRVKQAEALVNFINSTVIPAANDHDVIILGDLNAYFEEDPIDVLRAAGFISLFGPESYSYVFNGQSGSLDHALVTPSLLDQFTAGGKWHINADEPIFLDYNLEFKAGNRGNTPDLYEPTPFRSSDHDPVLVGLRLQNPVISFVKEADQIGEKSGEYVVQVQLSKPKQRDEEVLVSITTTAQYGLNGKGDYITMPDGSAGSFKLTIPAGQTTASFTVIPDKNAAKKREPFTISFTLSNQTGGLDVGQPATFDLQIFDDQDGLALGQYAVWPNPTTGPITLSRNAEDYLTDQVKVTLRSDIGEILYSGSGFLPVLSYQLSSRLQSGRAGFYLVEVEANGTLTQIRVLKQ